MPLSDTYDRNTSTAFPAPCLQQSQTALKTRFDAFLIWPHGLKFLDKILDRLRSDQRFDIIKLVRHQPADMAEFVKAIYARDYVPYAHLISKTEYLLTMPADVAVIFTRTHDPGEQVMDAGWYAHVESTIVRDVKNELRDRYNPREDGRRTEDHVVHASDHESHTNHLLMLLGYKQGLAHLDTIPNPVLDVPYHIPPFSRFRLKKIAWRDVRAAILTGDRHNPQIRLCHLEETPHCKYLNGEQSEYLGYIKTFQGTSLTDDHNDEKIRSLATCLRYLEPPHHTCPVIVEEVSRYTYKITDGLHRACVLLQQGASTLLAAVVER